MQDSLFHERLEDALKAVIDAAGGPKTVGHRLFPELSPDEAGDRIRACLRYSRRERLNLRQIDLLFAIGREAGCDAAMHYLADAHGYERPRAVTRDDQRDEARRELAKRLAAVEEYMPLARRLLEGG